MLLMCSNRVCGNTHHRCQCTYCYSFHMWQQISLATPSVLQQLLLQHPWWLSVLLLTTLHGVARTLSCVAIEKSLWQHQNNVLHNPIATVTVATPPNHFFVLQFCLLQHFLAYCNTFRLLHHGGNLVVLALSPNISNRVSTGGSSLKYQQVLPKWFLRLWCIRRKSCTYLAPKLTLFLNRPK